MSLKKSRARCWDALRDLEAKVGKFGKIEDAFPTLVGIMLACIDDLDERLAQIETKLEKMFYP